MLRRNIDPQYSQFLLDTCAFDPKYDPENSAAEELWRRYEDGEINLVLAHSNQREIDHPNTPRWVKTRALAMVSTVVVSLTPDEFHRRAKLEQLLRGNAQSDKHKDDAHHLFEASKYAGYFVTTDNRILRLAGKIFELCSVQVLKPGDAIYRMNLPEDA